MAKKTPYESGDEVVVNGEVHMLDHWYPDMGSAGAWDDVDGNWIAPEDIESKINK